MSTAQKPLLIEAVMFFSERGICKEMLYPEFEALLDGLVASPEFADETIEAVFVQINNRLQVRACVFFTLDFDLDGYVNKLWNLPLRNLAEKAGRGPDLGGGPIRLVCLGFTHKPEYRPHLWKPGQRAGRADLALVREAVTRNALGILGEDEEAFGAVAAERLQIAAEDAWYGGGNIIGAAGAGPEQALTPTEQLQLERQEHARHAAEQNTQINALQEQLQALQREHDKDRQRLLAEHAEHLRVAQGELLDIKRELDHQQKLNALMKRELLRLQNRSSAS